MTPEELKKIFDATREKLDQIEAMILKGEPTDIGSARAIIGIQQHLLRVMLRGCESLVSLMGRAISVQEVEARLKRLEETMRARRSAQRN